MSDFDRLVADQHLIFTVAQARAAGISRHEIATRVRRRQWQRVHPRIYATTSGPLTLPARLTAAVLYAGPDVLFGHATAAALWGLPVPETDVVHLVVPHDRKVVRQPGLEIHRAVDLPPEHRGRRRGFPVTSIDRSVVDSLLTLRDRASARALAAAAVQSGRTTADRLAAAAGHTAAIRREWCRQLLDDIAGGSQSELELRFLDLCRVYGLPMPERQVRVGRHRVDAMFGHVVVELDSRTFHFDAQAWEHDLARQNELMRRGRIVLRFTWRMIVEQPEQVAAQIRVALAAEACG